MARTREDLRITARMLDAAFVEAVRAGDPIGIIQAEENPDNPEQEDQAIDPDRIVGGAAIGGPEEGEADSWFRRRGRLFINAAGNWQREGRLLRLER